ncbi:hypothetical protein CA13_57850 [Planctomycetes bacterium CA13]|uniref:Uncharacterized protein n=1 Tax=Novipirellula herctigrandis TaxID=2527986 RepID=A0A5C5ZAY0_9BACT|nr:hypothetical protein CA13_57850 [Planctomycetes bacterium CA13]
MKGKCLNQLSIRCEEYELDAREAKVRCCWQIKTTEHDLDHE